MDGPDWSGTALGFLQEKAASLRLQRDAALLAQKHAVGMAFIAFKGRDNGDEFCLHQLRIELGPI